MSDALTMPARIKATKRYGLKADYPMVAPAYSARLLGDYSTVSGQDPG